MTDDANGNTKYIFLDFDGVLHKTSDSFNLNEFKYLENLVFLILIVNKAGYNPYLVASTSWRTSNNITVLKSLLRYDILKKSGLIGFDVTGREIMEQTDIGYETNNRFLEIKDYIDINNIKYGDYVVIDDNIDIFFKTIKNNDEIKTIKLLNNNYHNTNELTEFENEFINSFVCTYKDDIDDGYLSEDDVNKAVNILTKQS